MRIVLTSDGKSRDIFVGMLALNLAKRKKGRSCLETAFIDLIYPSRLHRHIHTHT